MKIDLNSGQLKEFTGVHFIQKGKTMKIILIALPSPYELEPATNPPMGLCYISSYLKEHGFNNIEGIDFGLYKSYDYYNSKEYLEEIPSDGDVYGISCMSPQFKWLVEISHFIKTYTPHAKIIVGGPHATNCPEDCLTVADAVVYGDGEEAMLRYLQGYRHPNIIYPNPIGDIYYDTYQMIWNNGLDTLPYPDRDLFGDLHQYKRTLKGDKAVHIMTLRGCPYKCAFCDRASTGNRVRFRLVENVIGEISFIQKQYGINSFILYDELFTLNHERVRNFCKQFLKMGITWRCWTRADTITSELLTTMKDSGLSSILIGIESGDDRILKNLNKNITVEQNKKAVLTCKEVDVPVQVSFIYGSPGETKESLDNTIKFVKETQPDEWIVHILIPTPGSDIWERPEHYGIIFNKEWVRENYYSMTHRIGNSGMGTAWARVNTMTPEEHKSNLIYFINELKRVCTPKRIQDTRQEIHLEATHVNK